MSNKRLGSVIIRPATAEDNVLLSKMGAETFADSFGHQNTPENMQLYLQRSFSPDLQAKELADSVSVFLVAEVGTEPVGYTHLRQRQPSTPITASQPVEIKRIYARAQWIGRGIGAALMEASLNQAKSLGCDVIWLGVWEHNQRAIEFYRKWGFIEFGNQSFHLGDDVQSDILMARPVLPSVAA